MHFVKKKIKEKRKDFVKKLKSGKILRVPGAYNPLTAKVIEELGLMILKRWIQMQAEKLWIIL